MAIDEGRKMVEDILNPEKETCCKKQKTKWDSVFYIAAICLIIILFIAEGSTQDMISKINCTSLSEVDKVRTDAYTTGQNEAARQISDYLVASITQYGQVQITDYRTNQTMVLVMKGG